MVPSASSFEAVVPARHATAPPLQAWWSGFGDPTLDSLIAAATAPTHSAAPPRPLSATRAEIAVALTYIALNVETLSLRYIENARSAVARQSQLMQQSKPLHDDFQKQLAQRHANADDAIRKIQAQRESHIAWLAAQCRLSEVALRALVADTLQGKALPRFALPVPSELPMALLANRDDVDLAASLYGIDAASALDGVIATTGQSDAGEPAQAEDSSAGYPLYPLVVEQARKEVSGALLSLQSQSDATQAAYRRMLDAKDGFELSKARHDRGQLSEVQLMEDFQGLMLALQRLAVANGDLAVAWIAFLGSIGGDTSIQSTAAWHPERG
ncbi:hypothetical protein [Variovorax sp. WS11]|uniref:hypothetical protein n=1 Tax=Variovorax sp. WS11 TaxID=1105204 RepID=UPI0011B28686|nr:hypothetical protein [Variovorax sp. WS11]NDZ18329.1 hypothetical protein [Variovorax sp. WS11]